MNLTYQAGYNRIWSFGSGAEAYGMGYYQGATAPGGADCIGFHFGNTATPLFYVNNAGAATFRFIYCSVQVLRLVGMWE
jgi:hypothetical protein